jgi:hypothetical protein
MIDIPIELPWWPPDPGEPIGAARRQAGCAAPLAPIVMAVVCVRWFVPRLVRATLEGETMTDPRPDPDARPVMGDHPELELDEPAPSGPNRDGDGRPGWVLPVAIGFVIVVIVVLALTLV